MTIKRIYPLFWYTLILIIFAITAYGCTNGSEIVDGTSGEQPQIHEVESLQLPVLDPIELSGRNLKVVVTTSIMGDLVSQVGDDFIDLAVLIDAGRDPHSYEPTAEELIQVADADVIFVNGWGLEEGLLGDIEAVSAAPMVPLAANIRPRILYDPTGIGRGEVGADDQQSYRVDPHVWQDPHNAIVIVENVARILEDLDPENKTSYEEKADEYSQKLNELVADYEMLLTIPQEKRKLVTNHDSLGYFADAYGFKIVGTIIPGASALAEPSAQEIAALVQAMDEAGVCTIFSETTRSNALAEAITGELSNCDTVNIITLYTGSLGPSGSGADTYLTMMESNLEALLGAFR